jgi:hypothetical protein
VAAGRHTNFAGRADALERQWTQDVSEGVPASSLTPLRQKLEQSDDRRATWWSPHWWGDTGQGLLDQLQQQTNAAWSSAISAARSQAQAAVAGWVQLTAQLGSFIPSSASADAATWPAKIAAASTPAELIGLAST